MQKWEGWQCKVIIHWGFNNCNLSFMPTFNPTLMKWNLILIKNPFFFKFCSCPQSAVDYKNMTIYWNFFFQMGKSGVKNGTHQDHASHLQLTDQWQARTTLLTCSGHVKTETWQQMWIHWCILRICTDRYVLYCNTRRNTCTLGRTHKYTHTWH